MTDSLRRSELLERGGYSRALAGEFFIGERQLLTRDGRLIPTLLHTATEVDASEEVIGTRAMFVDITERKRAELALSKQADVHDSLMEAIPILYF
jgi:PAS domain S-box-containing protein